MHCWKSYHLDRGFYFFRRFFISSLFSFMIFIFSYMLLAAGTQGFEDDQFGWMLIALILLYPVHKLLHILPVISYYKHMSCELNRYFRIIPIIEIKVESPVPKKTFGLALILPFMIINIALLSFALNAPEYGHYISILLAYHNGISFFDLIYFKELFFSPKNALVEECDDGYEILVEEQN